jgi:RNA polymerase-binding transcription factor DksA
VAAQALPRLLVVSGSSAATGKIGGVNAHDAELRLTADLAATVARIEAMSADLAAHAAASAGSNVDDEHDPEGATIAFEREQLAALRLRARQHLADVDAALARLREGRYGRCERCGGAVAQERLEALPATRLCLSCASRPR